MKLITRNELVTRPTSELRGLLRQTFDALAHSTPARASNAARICPISACRSSGIGARTAL